MLKKLFRFIAVMLWCFPGVIWCQHIENSGISGNYNKVPTVSFLSDVEKNYAVTFYYRKEWFNGDSITIDFDQTSLSQILEYITQTKPYFCEIIQDNIIVLMPKDKVQLLLGGRESIKIASETNMITIGNPGEFGNSKEAKIEGTILDGKNNEPLIGAFIHVENTSNDCQTNTSGKFSFTLPPGLYSFIVTLLGYEQSTYKVKIATNGSLSLQLFEKTTKIDDITIYANRPDKNVSKNQMSLLEIGSKELKQLPSLTGEKDIIKSFTMLPGVKSVGEFGSGINVRGGGEDQNLYLIEGAPIFNTSHVFGLLSVVNPDAVSSVVLYKGQIPAMYGERVSSVMEIQVTDNTSKKTKIKGGIGIYDSRLLIEGPLGRNINYKIGGRTSYSNWLMHQMPDINLQSSSASFYDVNTSVNWNFKKDQLTLFVYKNNDQFNYSKKQAFSYGNNLGSVKWTHYYNKYLNAKLTYAYSQYDAQREKLEIEYEKNIFSTQVIYQDGKYNVEFTKLTNHIIDAGLQVINYSILPGSLRPANSVSLTPPVTLNRESAWESGIYINDSWEISKLVALNLGIRVSGYLNKISNNQTCKYSGFEPRISAKYQFNPQNSIKISYNRNIQYMSLLSYSAISIPTDIWKLADQKIKPINSDQIALGYYRNNKSNTIEISTEIYYKKLDNLLEFRNNATVEMNPDIDRELLDAHGENYGIEIMIKKKEGKLDGWLSYTYSRSLRKTTNNFQEKINNGRAFPSAYDKPHSFTFFGTYHINKCWRISGNFSYTSGRPVTLPEYSYQTASGAQIVVFSDRNKYRTPVYHRLDLSISMDESLKISKRWKGSWTFSILNVYGRHNTYSVIYMKVPRSEQNMYSNYSLDQLYIIGKPLPTLTYNFIF